MTDLRSEDARLDEPNPIPAVDPPAEPTIVLEETPGQNEPPEVERLRIELAVMRERLRAVEELARERAGRIADLRVILRMLPPSSQPVPPAGDPPGSSVIWIPDRASPPGPGQERAHGSTGWSPLGSPPRPDPHSERIWQSSEGGMAEVERATVPEPAPPVRARPNATQLDPAMRASKSDWREDYRDFPRPRHRRAHVKRPWLWRFPRPRG